MKLAFTMRPGIYPIYLDRIPKIIILKTVQLEKELMKRYDDKHSMTPSH